MENIRIKDIYAGMPDAKDEISTDQFKQFFESFIVPPELPIDKLLAGQKHYITGYKGVGKTSVLFFLQKKAQENDKQTCTSFMYFRSDFEEVRRSNMEAVAKKLTSIIDLSGEIQPNKIEYLHIWRWVFFKKILDDNKENEDGLFIDDNNWRAFANMVNSISFNAQEKNVISLSSLSLSLEASTSNGLGAKAEAHFNSISKSSQAFHRMINIVDECENYFKKLKRTDIPYYLFVDEIEAYYGNRELFIRDLTLIRDMVFTISRINSYGKIRIIAAVRNEIIYAMERFIQTRELNKILDGYSVPLRWSYSNNNSVNHPIIQILMKRISIAADKKPQRFEDWFPIYIRGRSTVSYILDNGWNKPRDIVRLLNAAQNDAIHCNDNRFTQASFDSLRKEYSKRSLAEIKQELQSLYSNEEINMILDLLRGGPRIFAPEDLRKQAAKGSKARAFIDEKFEDIMNDFYRVGFWGNVNRSESNEYRWRWNHKGDSDVILSGGWELALHHAICSELSIIYK